MRACVRACVRRLYDFLVITVLFPVHCFGCYIAAQVLVLRNRSVASRLRVWRGTTLCRMYLALSVRGINTT